MDGWKLLLSTVISRIYCGSCIGVLGAVKPLDMGSVWCFGLGSSTSVALHLVRGEFLRDGMYAFSLARLLGHCLSSILRGLAAPL